VASCNFIRRVFGIIRERSEGESPGEFGKRQKRRKKSKIIKKKKKKKKSINPLRCNIYSEGRALMQ
jgi:CRP-like cAMP-binding protein